MIDRVIVICCILLVFTGFIIGVNFDSPHSLLEGLSKIATILGGFATVAALVWAYVTYNDWQKTQRNNEYDSIIELGKSSLILLESTTYLFESMVGIQHEFEKLSDLEHKLRDGKIQHSVTMFERSIERYSDARALIGLLESPVCSDNDYAELDDLLKNILDWFWLFRYENVTATTVIGESKDGYTSVHSGVKIPKSKQDAMHSLDLKHAMAPYQFQKNISSRLESIVKGLILKLSNN